MTKNQNHNTCPLNSVITKPFLIWSLIKKNKKESGYSFLGPGSCFPHPASSQHPGQRKHSVILAPFNKMTVGSDFPSKNCWLDTQMERQPAWTWVCRATKDND